MCLRVQPPEYVIRFHISVRYEALQSELSASQDFHYNDNGVLCVFRRGGWVGGGGGVCAFMGGIVLVLRGSGMCVCVCLCVYARSMKLCFCACFRAYTTVYVNV